MNNWKQTQTSALLNIEQVTEYQGHKYYIKGRLKWALNQAGWGSYLTSIFVLGWAYTVTICLTLAMHVVPAQ